MASTPKNLNEDEKAILTLRKRHDAAEEKYIEARSKFRESVATYLDKGGSPTRLGKILGVTRGRIYQYRDAAEREDRAS